MREVKTTSYFNRKLATFVIKHPDLRSKTLRVVDSLAENPFVQKHKTHVLSGRLKGLWGASINYHYRLVFMLTDSDIVFINVGSHDEVY